ncbi:MAG: penicillin acylase family protein [Gammaproteobacteria bacterium]|nr:penicillin acylase family protein [Gammaproteobacteria bacterium]
MNKLNAILAAGLMFVTLPAAASEIILPGLDAPVTVTRDSNGIPHIRARNEHDLFFMQGRVHAEDRLWQMDLLRRSAAGTLAELFGPPLVASDVETRTIGFSRAAERSLAAHSAATREIFEAYSAGVNSFIDAAETAGQLPPEYGALTLGTVKRWTPLDTVLVGKALGAGTSFDVAGDIDLTIAFETYRTVGTLLPAPFGFDGSALFFGDLFRSEPLDPASTVPDALNAFPPRAKRPRLRERLEALRERLGDDALEDAEEYLERIRKLPKIPGTMSLEIDDLGGSNTWVIGGQHTPSGRPLLANDAHLPLESPTFFHDMHLVAPGYHAIGSTLPGAPCVARGHNASIAWGVTNARLDITDVFDETVVPAPTPSGLATLHDDGLDPVELVFEAFLVKIGGSLVPARFDDISGFPPGVRPVLIVPRRNHGPLITPPDETTGAALSVQSTGFGPTLDPEGLCDISRAQNLDEFKAALQKIDFASQHFSYADRHGNIAYFASGELPLRKDLQKQTDPTNPVTPPFLIRDGKGGEDWLPLAGPLPPNQATPYAILPFDEMPRVENPPGGVIVNANNDPVGNTLDNNVLNDFRAGGNGLRYLSWGGRSFSLRAGRITEMIGEELAGNPKRPWRRGKISFADMRKLQADIVLSDARIFTPYIFDAWDNANAAGAHPVLASFTLDPRIAEAVERLRHWDFRTPTGIPEGYDAKRDENDAASSVATTIYSTWRGKMVANTIDATLDGISAVAGIDLPKPGDREELLTALKHLLDCVDALGGVDACENGVSESGLNFFNVPGFAIEDPAARRDIVILASLAEALNLLADEPFAPAFANSTDQDDYRWGRLHRIVIKHALGDVDGRFNFPPAFGLFPPPLADLAGIPTDGAFETVDVGSPLSATNVRVRDSDSFMFDSGATGRLVAWLGWFKVRAVSSLPGGESGVPFSPFYVNLLDPYLRNETYPLLTSPRAISAQAYSTDNYRP